MVEKFNRLKNRFFSMPTRFSSKTIPFALLATLIVSFGLLVKDLGFYQDDWHHIYFGHTLGLSRMWDMFLYDGRPLAAVLYILGFKVLGFAPLHWHISTLALRALTILFTWLIFRGIWPEYRRQVAWAALLFVVYPIFKLQPLAVAYTVHWTGYLLFVVSIWAMVQSIRKPRWYWGYFGLALLTCGLHLAFIEYFSGVELARPFILWLLLSEEDQTTRSRIQKTLRLWLPFLLVLVAFYIYRIYLIPQPEPGYARNVPTVLFDLFNAPLPTAIKLVQDILQDVLYLLVTAWNNVFTPDLFKITQPANFKILLIAIGAGFALFFYLRRLESGEDQETETRRPWYRSALWLGLVLTVIGPIPAWVTGQSVSQDNPLWSGRLGMASMIGASLVLIAVLEFLVKDIKVRTIVLVILVTYSLSWHLLYTNLYRWSWDKQTWFFHQLYWRAPYIEPNTALLSDEEIFPYMGEYPTAFALGNLYPKYDGSLSVNYWFYSLLRRFNDQRADLISGLPFEYKIGFGRFSGNSLDSLVIHFAPEMDQCLWVLRPEDTQVRALPVITREIAVISDLERIKPGAPEPYSFPTQIFGERSQDSWCYFYQQADLARQFKDWSRVVELWQAAGAMDLKPHNGVEYLPFIEGFAYQREWQGAQELTLQANKLTLAMDKILCPTWQRIAAETIPSPEREQAIARIKDKVGCSE
ncbi:MAG: hypothetical protein A2Z49_10900 [Chloroflexi bacterium RBG_19FT_COMBO_56_12]|nr:MAG: hypothetical protein A2Z49_10900 [Chloroflexi bacterium RBG_19FT_COMBO_56_12]